MGTTAGVMTTNRRLRIGVQSGDVAPASYGMSLEGGFYSLEAQAGRPAALILAGALPASVIASVLIGFQESAAEFSRRRFFVFEDQLARWSCLAARRSVLSVSGDACAC